MIAQGQEFNGVATRSRIFNTSKAAIEGKTPITIMDTMANREWRRQSDHELFLVSTKQELLSDSSIQEFFATPAMYWASPLDPADMKSLRANSVFLGLYLNTSSASASPSTDTHPTAQSNSNSSLKTIGIARLITDHVTTIWLTDVYVIPEHQGKGLGKWLMQCVADLARSTPRLRRMALMAKNESNAVRFYEELLGAKVFDQVGGELVFMSTKIEGLDSA